MTPPVWGQLVVVATVMFEGFETRADALAKKRYAVSTVGAVALFGALGAVVLAAGASSDVVRDAIKKSVDVRFRPPPPPPPPPAPVKVATPPKPKIAARKPQQPVLAKVTTSAPAALVAPTKAPEKPAEEADASQAVAALHVAVGGTGDGRAPAGSGGAGAAPISLPENAVAPTPLASNVEPDFPPDARHAGKEGLVILKIVVDVDGQVADIQKLRGEEPFVSAATRAVSRWRFTPALVEGQPTPVYRIIKVPFRIRS